MKKINIKATLLYVSLLLVSSMAFATGDEEDRPIKPGTETVDEECGFFCTIGEFFEDIFG